MSTPHVTKNDKGRRSNLDRRTTRQPGYAVSLSRRWLVEKGFGWLKQTGPLRQVKLRGLEKVDWLFVFSCAALQPDSIATADRTTTTGKAQEYAAPILAQGRIQLSEGPAKPHQHWTIARFKPISSR